MNMFGFMPFVFDFIDKNIPDFIEKWEFSKENLAEALVSGKEVIISGKYTAINAFRFTELAEHTLGIKFKSWLDE